jgi:hypothetical protein
MSIETVSRLFDNADAARQQYVVTKQKGIKFGGRKDWAQLEGDEAVFKKTLIDIDNDSFAKAPSFANGRKKTKKKFKNKSAKKKRDRANRAE